MKRLPPDAQDATIGSDSTLFRKSQMQEAQTPRKCLRDPIPAIADAARSLDAAVTAHVNGRRSEAAELIRRADMLEIREWVESLWDKSSQYNQPRKLAASRESLSPSRRPPAFE